MGVKTDILFAVVPPSDSWLPNLGIACLQAYLRAQGCSSSFLDLNLSFMSTLPEADRQVWVMRTDEYWRDPRQRERFFQVFCEGAGRLADELLAREARLIGFHVHSLNHAFAVELARRVKGKDPARVILFGGPGVTDPELCASFPSCVDHCVVNEGEITVAELCAASRAGGDLSRIAGVHTNVAGEGYIFQPRDFIKDVDALPFPSFDDFPMDRYWGKRIPVLLSRGCVGRCAFCDVYSRWKGYRGRSAEQVFREIIAQVEKTGWRMLHFNDSLVNANTVELEKLCDLLISSGMKLQIEGLARAKRDTTRQILDKMRAAGFWKLQWGIETASPHVMRLMNKDQFGGMEVVKRNLADSHAAGIVTAINIIVGFPGETARDLRETIHFVVDNQDIIDQVDALNPCEALPLTDVTLNPAAHGIRFPGGETSGQNWVGRDGSTYAERLRRKAKVVRALAKTRLTFGFDLAPEIERVRKGSLREKAAGIVRRLRRESLS